MTDLGEITEMSDEELADEREALNDEILDIEEQLRIDREFPARGSKWRASAHVALQFRRKELREIIREVSARSGADVRNEQEKINEIIAEREDQIAKKYRKLLEASENREASLRQALAARDKKVRTVQLTVQRGNHAICALKNWIRDNHPALADEAHSVISLAQAEWDARVIVGES